jgi:hypothetical protein
MARTTSALVQAVLGDNYGPKRDGSLPDLTEFIVTANTTVNRVQMMAATKVPPRVLLEGGYGSEAELVERWLAAHFYHCSDQTYNSRATEGASGQFQAGPPEKGFQSSEYGRMAVSIDWSGCLENLGKKQRAGAIWLGRYPSDQTPYDQKS